MNIAAAVDPDAGGRPDYSDMAVADKNTETLISSHGMAEPNSQEAVRIFPEASTAICSSVQAVGIDSDLTVVNDSDVAVHQPADEMGDNKRC